MILLTYIHLRWDKEPHTYWTRTLLRSSQTCTWYHSSSKKWSTPDLAPACVPLDALAPVLAGERADSSLTASTLEACWAIAHAWVVIGFIVQVSSSTWCRATAPIHALWGTDRQATIFAFPTWPTDAPWWTHFFAPLKDKRTFLKHHSCRDCDIGGRTEGEGPAPSTPSWHLSQHILFFYFST